MTTSSEQIANRTGTQANPIRSGEQYIESLRGRDLNVFLFGERVEEPVDHPIIRPSINAVARTYDSRNGNFAVHR
jgi:4-hydroxybutyryl-CoA dehydratase/vinylacetyl-CoA-Delta-isomerase